MLATSDLAVYGYKENKNPWSYLALQNTQAGGQWMTSNNTIILALSQNSQVETFPVLYWRFLQF